MTRFLVAPDGEGEPTVFRVVGRGESAAGVALFRRCDLPALPDRDQIWDALVAAVMSGQESPDALDREADGWVSR